MRHNPGRGIMANFVGQRADQIEIAVEGGALRHEHLVDVRPVIGIMQAIFDRDANALEEGERIGDGGGDGRHLLDGSCVRPIHLVTVEHDERAGEESGTGIPFPIACGRAGGGILPVALLPQDDVGAGFTLADLRTAAAPLLKRCPCA